MTQAEMATNVVPVNAAWPAVAMISVTLCHTTLIMSTTIVHVDSSFKSQAK